MDDLTLCKKIAELEGVEVGESVMRFGDTTIPTGRGLIDDNFIEYNPLTNWLLLGPLMLKYEIEVDYQSMRCVFLESKRYADDLDIKHVVDYDDVDQLPRAILECIIKSKG